MTDLPPLAHGRVVGRFVAGVADSDDAGDVPDVVPLAGTVTFTLSVAALRVVSASPVPTTIYPQPITATLDADGYLTHNGSRGVSLLATDDPATNPTDLQYTVTLNLWMPETSNSVNAPSWRFALPGGSEVDLTQVAPIETPAPNTIILKGERGDPGPNIIPTNQAVADAVSTDGPAKEVLLSTIGAAVGTAVPTSPRTVLGPRTVFDGDSITIAGVVSGAVGQDLGTAWVNSCVRASNGRIRLLFNAGLAGQTAAGALSRFDTYVAPYAPQTVVLTIGTNDDEQSRSIPAYLADVEAYWQKCLAIGAKLVLGAIYPTSYNTPAGRPAASRARNVALYEWARAHDVFVIPFDKLADPVTGGWPAGWSSDLIHPGSDSDWYSGTIIGEFAWSHLSPMYGGVAVKEATVNGADSVVNGFFTSLASAISTPAPTIANDTASGSLPAGTYQYVVTTVDYFGQSLPSGALTTTLTGTGKVSITVPAVSGNQGYRVYRKVGADYLLLGRFPGGVAAVTIVDDGSAVPAGVLPSANLSQVRPSGVSLGATTPYRPGQAGAFADPAFRGNSLRISPYDTNAQSALTVASATLTAGEVWEITCRVKDYGAPGQLYLRVKVSSSGSTLQTVQLARGRMPSAGGLIHYRFTVPATATYSEILAIGLPTADGKYWAMGELRMQKVS